MPRPPIQSSDVGATALAIHGLQRYPLPGRRAEFSQRVARARDWLWSVKADNHEQRVFQLLGLAWSGVSPARLQPLAQALLAEQRHDGGWSQLPALESDAFATGQAIYALRVSVGFPTSNPPMKQGIRFLLENQLEDGTWHVRRWTFPFQPTMKSGFPHGRDSTNWSPRPACGAPTRECGGLTSSRGRSRRPVTPSSSAASRRGRLRRTGCRRRAPCPWPPAGHPDASPPRSSDLGMTAAFADEVASRLSHSLDNALRYEREREVSHALQPGLLGAAPAEVEGVEIATVYRPGSETLEVGGDWYDVFRLGDTTLALVVGDVVGHGLDAAVAMGQLRGAVRALAPTGSPSHVLDALDLFVEQVPQGAMATLAYAELDLEDGRLTYACAGHPPPLLLGSDGGRLLWRVVSPPGSLVQGA